MPFSTPAAVRKQIREGKPDPVYVIVGDDDAEMSRLANDISELVEAEPAEDLGEPSGETDVLDAYIKDPVPQTTLVLVASDVDRTRKIYKTIQKHATFVECW